MSYSFTKLLNAVDQLKRFRSLALSKHHERYLFPYLCGSYFSYRKIDILRIKTIAEVISNKPNKQIKYLDIGCGNGDFLEKIREYIPNAKGIENNIELFYLLACIGRTKPDYIELNDVRYGIDDFYDIIFVGWMDPGQDFRKNIAEKTDIIITTLDAGLSLAAEYEGYGFKKIVKWITPSWEDVNIEITNHFYSNLDSKTLDFLTSLRGAHNFWYIYSKDNIKSELIIDRLKNQTELEADKYMTIRYDFEKVLDECGFSLYQSLQNHDKNSDIELWKLEIPE
ncbi:MAG TPA: hypothetical protein VFM31_02200 [Nitrososphaeraceae archaeon]|nr:hypothetical protein [Nitrososphaeraceae archaeon]